MPSTVSQPYMSCTELPRPDNFRILHPTLASLLSIPPQLLTLSPLCARITHTAFSRSHVPELCPMASHPVPRCLSYGNFILPDYPDSVSDGSAEFQQCTGPMETVGGCPIESGVRGIRRAKPQELHDQSHRPWPGRAWVQILTWSYSDDQD
jgi:hypothetical protein